MTREEYIEKHNKVVQERTDVLAKWEAYYLGTYVDSNIEHTADAITKECKFEGYASTRLQVGPKYINVVVDVTKEQIDNLLSRVITAFETRFAEKFPFLSLRFEYSKYCSGDDSIGKTVSIWYSLSDED